MTDANSRHKQVLLSILGAVNAPVSLTDLSKITGIQKTTVSTVLKNAAAWGEVSTWKEGPDSQTMFDLIPPPITTQSFRTTRFAKYTPPKEHLHDDFVGNLRLLSNLESDDEYTTE